MNVTERQAKIAIAVVFAFGLSFGFSFAYTLVSESPSAADLEEASEKVATPYEDRPWYLTGAAPMILIVVPVAIGTFAVSKLRNWRRSA